MRLGWYINSGASGSMRTLLVRAGSVSTDTLTWLGSHSVRQNVGWKSPVQDALISVIFRGNEGETNGGKREVRREGVRRQRCSQ
jgi:hypothetical protein